jgi:DNA-binding beta-propeller fold protein YncE
VDLSGNVYVADTFNDMIRKITPDGFVTTLAGSGAGGADNGPAHDATFNGPEGIAVDSTGIIYVADSGNHIIRKIKL